MLEIEGGPWFGIVSSWIGEKRLVLAGDASCRDRAAFRLAKRICEADGLFEMEAELSTSKS